MTWEEFITPQPPPPPELRRKPFEQLFEEMGLPVLPLINVSRSERARHQTKGRGSLVPTRPPYN